jgi:hypothetical protein
MIFFVIFLIGKVFECMLYKGYPLYETLLPDPSAKT